MFCPCTVGISRQLFYILSFYLCYLLFGSIIFVYLEEQNEEQKRNETMGSSSHGFKKMLKILQLHNYSYADIRDETWEMENEIHVLQFSGQHNPNMTHQLPFASAVFFSFTLISTIGYGDVFPRSAISKIMCILYTFLGIPITTTLLQLIGFQFRHFMRIVIDYVECHHSDSSFILYGLPTLVFILAAFLFLMVPAFVFMASEHWSWAVGMYYNFITLATVGLGDYVARGRYVSHPLHELFMFAIYLWLIPGLAYMSAVLNLPAYFVRLHVLDKVECRCDKGEELPVDKIKRRIGELNVLLSWHTPEDDTTLERIKYFQNIYDTDPESITEEDLISFKELLENLLEIFRMELNEHNKSPDLLRVSETLSAIDWLTLPSLWRRNRTISPDNTLHT